MDPRVDKYLNTNIKDLINEFNGVQNALDVFEIGCAPCSLGTCKLKDVVGIHNLNAENEIKLFNEIFALIYPGEKFDIPRVGQDKKSGNSVSLSPPMRLLVDEHKLIKRVLALVPVIADKLNLKITEHKQMVQDVADFIRNYADTYHHAKEEDILFSYFDPNLDIIKVMVNDHIQSRLNVANMRHAAESENTLLAIENLINYTNLLTEHIQKEDTILYPWMDKNLETKQVGEMYSRFLALNNDRPEIQKKWEAFVANMEAKFTGAII